MPLSSPTAVKGISAVLIAGLFLLAAQPLWAEGARMGFAPSAGLEAPAMDITHDVEPQGLCPQVRGTEQAPLPFREMMNPLDATTANIEAGERLFQGEVRPVSCKTCHGFKGNGFGVVFQRMKPYPRDFTCFQVMDEVSDGQLFWIIRTGSHGTRMKAFSHLSDEQIWQLVTYIRKLAR